MHVVIGVDPVGTIYVLDLWREQTTSDVWVEAAIDLMKQWEPLYWGEEAGQIEKGVGPFLLKRMREREVYCARRQFTSSVDKPTRARPFQARMAMGGGMVRWPASAPWYPTAKSELLKFPLGKNDDIVDALSLIGRMLAGLVPADIPHVPPDVRALGVQVDPNSATGQGGGHVPMTWEDMMRERKRNKRRG